MNLLLIRHGHPDYTHDCLTPLGHSQAERAADRLRDEKIDAFFSSPFGRAKETALHSAEGRGMEITVLPFMRELSWGPKGERDPSLTYNPWNQAELAVHEGAGLDENAPYLRDNTVWEYASLVAAGADEWLPTLGYVREGLYYRCTRENTDTYALFAHAGSFAALFSHLLNLSFPQALHLLGIGFTGISRLSFDPAPGQLVCPRITLLNDMKHLEGESPGR